MNDWESRANCRGMDPDLFFEYEYQDFQLRPPKAAVRACAGCEVRDECLDHALKHERYGYWGGTEAKERLRIRKVRMIRLVHLEHPSAGLVTHGTEPGYHAHIKHHSKPCDACLDAHARFNNPEGKRHLYTWSEKVST